MRSEAIAKALARAAGKWPVILLAAGVHEQHLDGKQRPCPICGGEDRFVFDNRLGRGDYFCRQCGPGDGLQLLRRMRGWTFKQVFEHIERYGDGAQLAAGAPIATPPPTDTTEDQFRAMMRVWGRARPVRQGDETYRYLAARAIGLSPRVVNLRTLPSWQDRPAEMLARVSNPNGTSVQIHRTLLWDPDRGRKERRMMPGRHPAGSAVRLYAGAARMGIAEGIENALSAASMFQIPVWAALNAGRLAKFDPPGYVECLEIFGDHDGNGVGQEAACELGVRMQQRGIKTTVHLPPTTDADWNTLLAAAMLEADSNPRQ